MFLLKASLCVTIPLEVSRINRVFPNEVFNTFKELSFIEKYLEGVLINLIFLKKIVFLKKKGDSFINFLDLDKITKEFKYPTLFKTYTKFKIFLLYFKTIYLRFDADNKFKWFIRKA